MIGKLKKGSSFAGCIRYVTGKDEAKILASDGVLLGTNAEMTQSFELQRQLNPRIKKPVGHIALSFKPEDKPRLTDEFMAKIAIEYMQMMGITDTQFIIVRHHNTDNPHCHIVYNRINNAGKLISDRNDYRRNEQVTKALKSRYGLTYGTDKSKTNTRKLRNAERAKYEIHNVVKDVLKAARRSVEGRRGTKHAGKKPCCQSGPPVLAARFYAGRRMPDREENKDKAHAYSERPVGESLENPQAGDRARHRAGKKRQDGFQAAGPHIQAYYGDHHERQGKAA